MNSLHSTQTAQGLLASLSYSIVGLYVTVVLTIGQFVRYLFANQVQRIPYEDLHDADALVSRAASALPHLPGLPCGRPC